MKRGGKTKFAILIAAASMAAITACCPKKSFASSKTPLSENKPVPVVFSDWSGGICSLNKIFGTITYKDKDNKETNSFEADIPENEILIGLHCSDEKTVVVKENEIIVYGQGANPKAGEIDESIMEILTENMGQPVLISGVSKSVPNEENEKNLAFVSIGEKTIILAKNKETGNLSFTEINAYSDEINYYEVGKLLEGNISMAEHNGILFLAGESGKGLNYLYAFKLDDKVAGIPYQAEKDLKGEVRFSTVYKQTDSDELIEKVLVLEIGKEKFYISAEYSEKPVPGFIDMGDGQNFAKITIKH